MTPNKVLKAERLARRKGVSIDELCRRAQVHRTTWQRWKSGRTRPYHTSWSRVVTVLLELQPLKYARGGAI